MPINAILIAALVTTLILLVEHYFPWPAILGRELRRVEAYVCGVLAIHLPLSVLLLLWSLWNALAALWTLTVAGGAVVLASHILDHYLDIRIRARIAEREALSLRPDDAQDD